MRLPSSSCLTFYQVTRLSVLTVVFFSPLVQLAFPSLLLVAGKGQLSGGIILLHARVCLVLSPAVFHLPRCSALSFSLVTFPGVFSPLIAKTRSSLHIASVQVTWAHLGKQVRGILRNNLRCSCPPVTSVGLHCIHKKRDVAASTKPSFQASE